MAPAPEGLPVPSAPKAFISCFFSRAANPAMPPVSLCRTPTLPVVPPAVAPGPVEEDGGGGTSGLFTALMKLPLRFRCDPCCRKVVHFRPLLAFALAARGETMGLEGRGCSEVVLRATTGPEGAARPPGEEAGLGRRLKIPKRFGAFCTANRDFGPEAEGSWA